MGEADSASNYGFSRPYRLLKPAEFSAAFASKLVVRGKVFAVHCRANDLKRARLGLVIPKKQAPTAVLRNAVKRQAREIFRLQRCTLPAVDLVLRLTQKIELSDKPAWRAEIAALFDRCREKASA